jgi:hypothetical protein
MSGGCREVVLGITAQWYFESWMREYRLPSLILPYVDWERGTLSTWVPSDVPDDAAELFEVGFLRDSTVYDCSPRQVLIDAVIDDLHRAERCIWIFEEPLGSPGDPVFVTHAADYIIPSATHVYYVLTPDMPASLIADQVSNAVSQLPPMIGVRSAFAAEQIQRPLTDEILAAVAAGVQSLMIGAYDGEGFVTWRPRV